MRRLADERTTYLRINSIISIIRNLNVLMVYLTGGNLAVKHITVHFSFPPLHPDNFRYKKNAGGGAIYDTDLFGINWSSFL